MRRRQSTWITRSTPLQVVAGRGLGELVHALCSAGVADFEGKLAAEHGEVRAVAGPLREPKARVEQRKRPLELERGRLAPRRGQVGLRGAVVLGALQVLGVGSGVAAPEALGGLGVKRPPPGAGERRVHAFADQRVLEAQLVTVALQELVRHQRRRREGLVAQHPAQRGKIEALTQDRGRQERRAVRFG